MAFWRCFYHVIWGTKNRQPLILPVYENILFEAICAKATEMKSHILAINSTDDHVHVAVNIPPIHSIADWMKNIKGVSSRSINQSFEAPLDRFQWQRGYGVVTFGVKNLDIVVQYIKLQKEHHAKGTTIAYLETTDDEA